MMLDNFEPNRNAKRMWLYTRKSKRIYRGVTLPGLFQTHMFWADAIGFTLVIALEWYGLANLWKVSPDFKFVYAAGLFAWDILFAVLFHMSHGPICENDNRAVAAEDGREQARYLARSSRSKLWRIPFAIAILAAALFKIVSFYSLQEEGFNGVTFAIGVSYAVVALLQIVSTGYFGSEIILRWLIRSQMGRFLRENSNEFTAQKRHRMIPLASLIRATAAGHRLEPAENSANWRIEAVGILMDDDLHELVGEQSSDDQKRTVAIHGLRLQLQILDAGAVRAHAVHQAAEVEK